MRHKNLILVRNQKKTSILSPMQERTRLSKDASPSNNCQFWTSPEPTGPADDAKYTTGAWVAAWVRFCRLPTAARRKRLRRIRMLSQLLAPPDSQILQGF